MKTGSDDSCGSCLALVILVILLGLVARTFIQVFAELCLFFTAPGLGERLLELGQALGLCCVVGVAALLVLGLLNRLFPPDYASDDSDEPY